MTPVSPLIATGKLTERSSPLRLVRGLIVTALCALLACALQGALSAGVAHAEVPRLVPNGSFASEGGLGVAVDNSCSLHVPRLTGSACTAFDPSSGDVFTTGFFSVVLEENEVTKTELQQLKLGHSEKFGATGNLLSPLSSFPEERYYGAAVNPTNGDVYAAGAFSHEIGQYDPNTGALLSSFVVPPFFTTFAGLFENTAQIAADSAGNVYVPNVPNNEVLEYSPIPACSGQPVECVPLKTFTGSGKHALSGPTGVAVDSSGDVWVADDGNSRIEEFGPEGAFLSEFKSQGVRALALDGQDVLAIVNNIADYCGSLHPPCAHLVEYSSGGVQLADVGAGDFGENRVGTGPTLPAPFSMVAVDEASGRVYVTDGEKSRVWVFQPPLAPVLGEESSVEVGVFEAKLGALVSPGGAQTTYRFEYDTREYGQGEGPHGVSVPFPEGSVGEGFSARTVWASAKGLTPGTTYHYRAIVTNGLGTVVGPDRTFTTETAAQVACPNEQFRGGYSAALPDCRAYEIVTPPSKESAQPDKISAGPHYFEGGGIEGNVPADDGNRISYVSNEVMPGSQSAGLEFVATRGASGWSSQDEIPLQPYTGDRCNAVAPTSGVEGVGLGGVGRLYSTDLSKAVVYVNGVGVGGTCRGELVEVVPGEPLGVNNLLLRDNTTGAYRLLTPTGMGVGAHSADLNLFIVSDGAKLTPEAPSTGGLYEWSEGVVRFLQFALPDGTPVAGSLVHISPDGSDLFFTAGGNLYMRVNHGERTIQLDEARGGPGPGGGGSFQAVTADGSQVFFTDDASAGLTSDTVAGSGTNLYSYDIATNRLSDLTPVAHAEAALTGIGQDGSYVYFAAKAVMSGSQANQLGETAESGKPNLYLDHDGAITFIMHATGVDLSSNGAFFAFTSTASLTGYDNNGHEEIYLYSAAANRLVCASCNPSGEAPTAGGVRIGGAPRSVSDNGQVFFQTAEALLPGDTNAQTNVYEYDYAGGLHLISSGTSSSASTLLGASASGDDVFFLGRQALVPQDSGQEANTIYDARADGGFPETTVPSCTTADACRTAPEPQPSIFGEPSSQTFSGIGNLAPPPPVLKTAVKSKKCKKGFVKKKGKCVKSKVKKKKTKAKKAAHTNRTGK